MGVGWALMVCTTPTKEDLLKVKRSLVWAGGSNMCKTPGGGGGSGGGIAPGAGSEDDIHTNK